MIKRKPVTKEIVNLINLHLDKKTTRKLIRTIKNRNFSFIYLNYFRELTESRDLSLNIDDIDYGNKFDIIKNEKNLINFLNKIKLFKINLPFKIGLKSAKMFHNIIANSSSLLSLTLCFGYYYTDIDVMRIVSQTLKSANNISFLSLYLNSNKISDNSVKILSQSLENVTNIKELLIKLNINKISDSGCVYLSESFSYMSKLSNLKLDLSYNYIGIEALNFLLDTIYNLPNLHFFILQVVSNKISEKELLQLNEKIKKFSQNSLQN
jgi:hypothetical protein